MKLTKEQKAKIVTALIDEAGTIVEFWDEKGLADIPAEEGRAYLASLMRRLPGNSWDSRLGDP